MSSSPESEMPRSANDDDPEVVIRSSRAGGRWIRSLEEDWVVYELLMPYDRRGPTLVFESENIVRRVRRYPENWRELTDEDLFRLSWST